MFSFQGLINGFDVFSDAVAVAVHETSEHVTDLLWRGDDRAWRRSKAAREIRMVLRQPRLEKFDPFSALPDEDEDAGSDDRVVGRPRSMRSRAGDRAPAGEERGTECDYSSHGSRKVAQALTRSTMPMISSA